MSEAVLQHSEQSQPLDIVVVDDDQLTLDMVSWNLRRTQSAHRLFTDSEAAMAHLCESMPGMLVVDYYMPTINGIDFLSSLHDAVGFEGSSVYLCSAVLPRQRQIEQITALGASVLDKREICNRSALLRLLEAQQCVTGNK